MRLFFGSTARLAVAVVTCGCATGTLPSTTSVADLSAISGRWNCSPAPHYSADRITDTKIWTQNDQAATMRLTWLAGPYMDWGITMRDRVAVIGYPRGGATRLPLQRAVEGTREWLVAVDPHGLPWLECQRPAHGAS